MTSTRISVPTLVDRELTLWESRIIMEYLDERFPHPPLMPVYPVARGESRLYMHRIEKDWYTLMNTIINGSASEADAARKQLREELLAIAPVFGQKPYFLSDELKQNVKCVWAGVNLYGFVTANTTSSLSAACIL